MKTEYICGSSLLIVIETTDHRNGLQIINHQVLHHRNLNLMLLHQRKSAVLTRELSHLSWKPRKLR